MRKMLRKVWCWIGWHHTMDLFVKPDSYDFKCRDCGAWEHHKR